MASGEKHKRRQNSLGTGGTFNRCWQRSSSKSKRKINEELRAKKEQWRNV